MVLASVARTCALSVGDERDRRLAMPCINFEIWHCRRVGRQQSRLADSAACTSREAPEDSKEFVQALVDVQWPCVG